MTDTAAVAEVDSGTRERPDGLTARRVVQAGPPLGEGQRTRVVDVDLGEYRYEARPPKLVVWSDMAQLIDEQQPQRNRGERRRAGERADVEPTIAVDKLKLTSALSHFIRGCLSRGDWAHVEQQLGDPDTALDIPDLWAAGLKLVVEFAPDMREMSAAIGMKVPAIVGALVSRAGDGDQAPAPGRKAPGRKAAGKGTRAR